MFLYLVGLLILFGCVNGRPHDDVKSRIVSETVRDVAVVHYFAYGTNMLQTRMREKCPSAIFIGPALLKGHRLDFTMEIPWWNGAVATITNDAGAAVWGVLWSVGILDLDKLDEQEGVPAGWYHQKLVTVHYEGHLELHAITYVQNKSPRKLNSLDYYPPERLPSKTYLEVMIMGAVQGGLPDNYIMHLLYSIPTNGKLASNELIKRLNFPGNNTNLLL